jgi:hypothetical protein
MHGKSGMFIPIPKSWQLLKENVGVNKLLRQGKKVVFLQNQRSFGSQNDTFKN